MTIVCVTVKVNLIGLIILTQRVVHHHDIVVIEVLSLPVFLIERLRGIDLGAYDLVLSIALGPGELSRRHTIGQGQDMIDGLEHLYLIQCSQLLIYHLIALACLGVVTFLAQLQTHLAEFEFDQAADLAGISGLIVVWHHLRRHYAILLHQIGHTAEGTAIRERILEEPINHTVIHRLLTCVDDSLEEKVSFLQLIIEEQIAL